MSFEGDFCPRGVCDGSGWLLDEETDEARPCECREVRINRASSRRIGSGIPRRFRTVSLESNPLRDFPPEVLRQVRDFVADIDDNLDRGRGFWFYGDVGTGKTSLAMVISRAAVEAGRSVAIYSMPQLLADIRATYEEGSGRSYLDLFRRLSQVDLLHVDDVGAEKTTEWVLEQLYAIVNERWQEQRSMLVTTNLTDRDRLREQLGERTVSRLSEMCATIPIMGNDLRKAMPDWEQRTRAEAS
ncbi:MAG: replication protein DnaC [Thermoleophilaceae bacterium]|nr:replication protein DnaC [Thermoleophilaceae bacterium]MEA2368678.1 replication protein DnaC [Thermoleophilaceae bacterium]